MPKDTRVTREFRVLGGRVTARDHSMASPPVSRNSEKQLAHLPPTYIVQGARGLPGTGACIHPIARASVAIDGHIAGLPRTSSAEKHPVSRAMSGLDQTGQNGYG